MEHGIFDAYEELEARSRSLGKKIGLGSQGWVDQGVEGCLQTWQGDSRIYCFMEIAYIQNEFIILLNNPHLVNDFIKMYVFQLKKSLYV